MSTQLFSQSCDTLGSTVELWVAADDQAHAERWFIELWDMVHVFNNRFSRFIDTSELSILNRQAGTRVPISIAFKQVLERTKFFSALTDGLFNPFVLPNLHRAGYTTSMTVNTHHSSRYDDRIMAKYTELEIGEDWVRIPQDTAIDLGGIGKGYLADELAAHLVQHTNDYCLSLGGDIHISGKRPEGSWVVDIETLPSTQHVSASYMNAKTPYGIATSGTTRSKAHKAQAHIIDPRTGTPVESDYSTATVAAADTTTADVLASCMLISGTEFAEDMIAKGYARAVLLQEKSGSIKTLGEGFLITDDSRSIPYNT